MTKRGRTRLTGIVLAAAVAFSPLARTEAATLSVEPELLLSEEQERDRLETLYLLSEGKAATGHLLAEDAPLDKEVFLFTDHGSHLRLTYSAAKPFAVFIVNVDPTTPTVHDPRDALTTTLPPGEQAEATVNLTPSPGWRKGREGFLMILATVRGNDVTLHDVTFTDRATPLQRVSAYLRHPWRPELFETRSVNFLRGYKLANLPLPLLLGTLLLAIVALLILRRRPLLTAFAIASIATILLYHTRFSVDLVRATSAELLEWQTQGTYRAAGSAYAVAERFQGVVDATSTPLSLTVCSVGSRFHSLLLAYLLHPTPVATSAESWSTATHAAMLGTWYGEREKSAVTCQGQQRRGEVIATFPAHSALVRFTDLLDRSP